MSDEVERWREVEALPIVNGDTDNLLATVDTVRVAWEDYLKRVSPEEFDEARRRTLTRHAIETGIIERLYEVSWGVTEALVAGGLTLEAAAREGGISADTLEVIHSQLDALELMVDAVNSGRPLSASFIKELHAAITRNQHTYTARDQFGTVVERPLQHGVWKEFPNDVVRSDGSRLQYTPPEHVQSQIEALLQMYEASAGAHPVVQSAWLHHRFVCIHPFQDGNGRVARALTLMVLLKARYAPLVVTGGQRSDYIDALERANRGDLRPLVRLFAGLELVSLKSELSVPVSQGTHATGAVPVAKELVARLTTRRLAEHEQRAAQAEVLAADMQRLIVEELGRLSTELEAEFRQVDSSARSSVAFASPGMPDAHHWHGQIVFTARRVDFFADLGEGSWWSRLHVNALGQALRYLVIVQKVGRGGTGVLAVTAFAEVVDEVKTDATDFRRAFEPTPKDSVTLVYTNSPASRWPEVAELIDRPLSVGLRYFADQLS
jgi:fido (protein-threonine AMPylation protein)